MIASRLRCPAVFGDCRDLGCELAYESIHAMSNKRSTLTTDFISKAPARYTKGPTLYPDGSNKLYLQVTPAGVRSFAFRYTIDGKTRSMGLGSIHALGLKEARKRALELSHQVARGQDPLGPGRPPRRAKGQRPANNPGSGPSELASKGPTFRECALAYIARRVLTLRSKKHAAQWTTTIEQYAFPKLGNVPVSAITAQDVVAVLEPIWFRIPETAARLRGRIEKICAYAAVMGYRDKALGNPAAWSGHLSEVLPARFRVRASESGAATSHRTG